MKAELLSPEDPRWQAFLEQVPHDVYHLPAYGKVSGRYEDGEPVAFYAEAEGSEILIPLLIRPLPEFLGAPSDWKDATTPYGYPSPLFRGDRGLRKCLDLFAEAGRSMGIVSAFLRLHPLIPLPAEDLTGCAQVVTHGQCVFFDLGFAEDEIWRRTRSNHRTQIRRLKKKGFVEEIDNWSDLDGFIEIYRETMTRLGACDFYFFPREYFYDLRAGLQDRLHLCSVRSPDGELAAAALFFNCNGLVQYHLGGTAEAFLDRAPSKLSLDAMRRWGQERGEQFLNLGGGTGGRNDSLFQFKLGFSDLTADFRTWRMILDAGKYSFLAERCSRTGQPSDFFPAYRRI